MGTVICDTEWGFAGDRIGAETAWTPVVLVARVGGTSHHFLGRDLRLQDFVAHHFDHTWVAHHAVAEMRYLLRLGLPVPPRWFCTATAFRAVTNRPGYRKSSLVEALTVLGLGHLIPPQKATLRDKILRLDFGPSDIPAIVAYCSDDVIATEAVFERLSGRIKPELMAYWTRYLAAVAKIEQRGIPIDVSTLAAIWRNNHHIEEALRDKINKVVRVFRSDGSFCREAFWAWADKQGIRWPIQQNDRGRWVRSLDDDHLKLMSRHHPFIGELRDVKKSLRALQDYAWVVDARSGKHYHSIRPFGTVTGRNQPKEWVFGAPKWFRWLIVPSPGRSLIYCDYSAQEIGIAAYMAGDARMQEMYAAPDPHLMAAIQAGAAPPDATEESHPDERAVHKTANLAALYAQGAEGVAHRLGIDLDAARDLQRRHREMYAAYHRWSRHMMEVAYRRGYATTRQGWRAMAQIGTRRRTWMNYPVQATGAEVMRCTTIAMDHFGLEVLAIVHDGWLVQCEAGDEERTISVIDAARRWACEKVVGGFDLKMDFKVYRERFEDKKGRAMWEFITGQIPEPFHIPDEG